MLILDRFQREWPPAAWTDLNVFVAVSGGSDSVALLRLMLAAREDVASQRTGKLGQLIVAHFDHRLRADSSDDAAWVESLAARLGLPFRCGQAESQDLSSEQQARQARYAFLTGVAEAAGARYLVTGHTSDDQAETILHHVIRGTGLAGLAGIARARALTPAVTLLRPLLGFTRDELRAYLGSIDQPYRDDPTNEQPLFTRNRLRNDLMPYLAEHFNPNVKSSLLRLGHLAREAQQEIEAAAESLVDACLTPIADGAALQLDQLSGASPFLIRELLVAVWKRLGWPLQEMTFEKWHALAELVEPATAAADTRQLPGGIRVTRRDNQLIMHRDGTANIERRG